MKWFNDIHNRRIRFTEERLNPIESSHPELFGQTDKIKETLLNPDQVIRSRVDPLVELFYRYYSITPINEKYLCVVVKVLLGDLFIITVYFTDTIKKGELIWEKK